MAEAAEEVVDEVIEEVIDDDPKAFEWPEDWRNQIAGDDEKALKQLGRYSSPADVWTKARALEGRVTSGELKDHSPFPEKGSDEDKAAWRANNSMPESFDKYEISREIGEKEKPVIDAFMEFAYSKNLPTSNVNAMVEWFYEKQGKDLEAMNEEDKGAKQDAEDALRAEWGPEYRAYINHVDNLLELAPAEVKEDFLDARLPNGKTLRDNPDAMKFLLGLALEQNPITTLVPGKGDSISGIEDEIEEIKGKMNTKEYQNSPKMRARYRELIGARDKMTKK